MDAVREHALHFADSLVARMRELGHPLCAGLDPHRGHLPPLFRRGSMEARDPETAAAVEEFLLAVLDRLDGRVAVVTGANRGLGYVSARELARHRASVVLACRDPARGEAAVITVVAFLTPGGEIRASYVTDSYDWPRNPG